MINNLKKKILWMSYNSKEGHIASAFSILDILWVLYDKILNVNPQKPRMANRDIFILSKGHASLAIYVILAQKGFFSKKHLENFCKWDSILGGHPDKNKIPGIEASTGSLGHGFPIAVGTALGQKINGSKSRTFVVVGDGESNEGTVWESALLASHHKLDNLCCIIDHNHSTDRALNLGNLRSKFEAFGWKCIEIDGHNHKQIEKATRIKHEGFPYAIIANTIKGKGIKSMENNPAWHHKSPTNEELAAFTKELSK